MIRFLILAGMLFCVEASAAEIYAGSFGSVHLDGFIQEGDAEKFSRFTSGYPAGTFIRLSGPGGLMGEALTIGATINYRGLSTVVSRNTGICGSACAIVFFSGRHAVIQGNSSLCFHTPYDRNSRRQISDSEMSQLADEIVKWGLTKKQALAILGAAPPNGMRCATEAWANILGLQYSTVISFGTMWRSCSTKFCLALP
jgi:hypothetical protein